MPAAEQSRMPFFSSGHDVIPGTVADEQGMHCDVPEYE
jgi:hypothetical protein